MELRLHWVEFSIDKKMELQKFAVPFFNSNTFSFNPESN